MLQNDIKLPQGSRVFLVFVKNKAIGSISFIQFSSV